MNGCIMLNEDDTHFYLTRYQRKDLSEETIREFIRQYANTQVRDFVLCIGGRLMDYPSKVRESWADKFVQKFENGREVDYSTHPVTLGHHRFWQGMGVDCYAVMMDEMRKNGIRPWVSLRMNDCHENGTPTSFLHPNFFHDHPEYRRVQHREPMEYFDRCYDYAEPEVRNLMLDTIREAADRYDVYGFELDWMREMFCFAVGREWEGVEILNDFMRDARAILNEAAEKWGHPVLLSARTAPDPELALEMGYDVHTWAREGLIDVIVPSPRWRSTDSDIPVEMWKKLLSGTNVQIMPALEILLAPEPELEKCIYQTVETTEALAAQYLSAGADGVYLFNYMDEANVDETGLCVLEKENYAHVLNTAGSLETVLCEERRHVKTYNDIAPEWVDIQRHAALPLNLPSRTRPKFVRVRVGQVPEDAELELRVGTDGEIPEAFVNSVKCEYLRTEKVMPEYTKLPAYVYRISNDGKMPPFFVVELLGEGNARVDYVEVHVIPKENRQ